LIKGEIWLVVIKEDLVGLRNKEAKEDFEKVQGEIRTETGEGVRADAEDEEK